MAEPFDRVAPPLPPQQAKMVCVCTEKTQPQPFAHTTAAAVTRSLVLLLTAILPGSVLARGPTIPWGASLAQVRKLHPGGKTIRPSGDEVEYRVLQRAYGQERALATYSFSPLLGLRRLVVDFPAPHAQVSLAHGTYRPRPSAGDAEALRRALVTDLTRVEGSPKHVDWDGPSGSASWGEDTGDWVVLELLPVANGRIRVFLHARRAADKTDDTKAEKNLLADYSKTTPASWAKSGAFGVHFGMGPGDVRKRYPHLSYVWEPASKPTQTYLAKSNIEGEVDMYFDFFQGRLIEMTIARNTKNPKASYGSLELYWVSCDGWTKRILEILTTKYGRPFRAPSRSDLAKAASMGAGFRPLRWAWKKAGMGIELSDAMRGMPELRYLEISSYLRATSAEQAHQRRLDKRERAKF